MLRQFSGLAMLVLLASTLQALLSAQLFAQKPAMPNPSSRGESEGKSIFASNCAACHGLDGRGGQRAPDIASRRDVQRLPDQTLQRIVRDGIAGTGMPAFRSLGTSRIQAVVHELRSLQGRNATAQLPGDPKRGKTLFFGKAGCSQCHMIDGEGGFMGSDLSRYGHDHSGNEIRSAIMDPNKNLDARLRTVLVTTTEGNTVTGIARNEDNFSLQLQTMDGTFHFFMKSELRAIEYPSRSLMPADYASRLSHQELDDLLGYLISTGRSTRHRKPEKE